MHEARIEQTADGLVPADDGWWALNLADLAWDTVDGGGRWCAFESPQAPSRTLGIGVHVLQPGESSGLYHHEADQEDFLILSGECTLVVEGEERRLRAWDAFHCPPGTAHITVGAGDGPCAILMAGTRTAGRATHYVVDPIAARHGASVVEPTTDSKVAYADRPPIERAPSPWASLVGRGADARGGEGAGVSDVGRSGVDPSTANPSTDSPSSANPSAANPSAANPSTDSPAADAVTDDDLRRQVAVLSAALGLREPLWDVPAVVREHVAVGQDVKAIRELRRALPGRIGLLEAKRMVDAIRAGGA